MLELIETYSLAEILAFVILLCLAIKGFVTFFDWAHDRLKKVFKKEEEIVTIQDQIDASNNNFKALSDSLHCTERALNEIMGRVNLLMESDKDRIKSWITREHHYFCYQKGWIDDYSLDCLEKQYNHYKTEGGNSFIEDFMEEIRELPKVEPKGE